MKTLNELTPEEMTILKKAISNIERVKGKDYSPTSTEIQSEIDKLESFNWWSGLSINEQKQFILKHPFFSQMGMDYFRLHKTSIQQVYLYCKEQKLI